MHPENFKKKLYFGTVAALLLTAEVQEGYKVVYKDGDCEDMTLAQLVTAQKRYMKIGKGMSRARTRVANARAFVAEWQSLTLTLTLTLFLFQQPQSRCLIWQLTQTMSQLSAKIHAERQIARDSLENTTFLVRAPKDVADKGRWSDHCYKVLPDLEQGGPIMVHRQLLQSDHTIIENPDEGPVLWMAWEALGLIFKVPTVETQGGHAVSTEEQKPMAEQYEGAFAAEPNPQAMTPAVLRSADKSKLTSHFWSTVQLAPPRFRVSALDV
jgi:hypothetical protein